MKEKKLVWVIIAMMAIAVVMAGTVVSIELVARAEAKLEEQRVEDAQVDSKLDRSGFSAEVRQRLEGKLMFDYYIPTNAGVREISAPRWPNYRIVKDGGNLVLEGYVRYCVHEVNWPDDRGADHFRAYGCDERASRLYFR